MGKFDDALKYYKLALNNRLTDRNVNKIYVARNMNNIGYSYLKLNNLNQAEKYFREGFSHAPLAVLSHNLGVVYTRKEKYIIADSLFQEALKIRAKVLGEKSYIVSETYYEMAELKFKEKKFNQALKFFNLSLNSCIKTNERELLNFQSNNYLKDILSVSVFLKGINGKARSLIELAKVDSSILRLDTAREMLLKVSFVIDEIQKYYFFTDSKLHLREISDELMNNGILICNNLIGLTKSKSYLNDALHFSEAKRYSVLNEELKNNFELQHSNVPDSLKAKEKKILQRINHFYNFSDENDLNYEKSSGQNDSQLFKLMLEYEKLKDIIYQFQPDLKPVILRWNYHSFEKIQTALNYGEIIVEYILTSKELLIFLIDKDSVQLIQNKLPRNFLENVNSFLASIKKINKKDFRRFGKLLYQNLIVPFQKEISQKNKLIVIPCAELSLIPFESLIDQKERYLVQKIDIDYKNISGLIENSTSVSNEIKYDFIGFAPEYHKGNPYLPPLNNHDEIISISKMFEKNGLKSSLVLGNNLSKDSLLKKFNAAKILHISAHSFVNEENAAISGIVVNSNADISSSIYNYEVAAEDVNSDLVVLSSCESGNGKPNKGEGVISLARSFLIAGARNLIVSLWKVSDKQTRVFMDEFYRELLKDFNYSRALSQAKRNLIKNNTHNFPNTWGAFVLIH